MIKLFLTSFPGGRLRAVKVLGPNTQMGDGFTYIRYLDTNGSDTTTDEFLYDIPDEAIQAWNQRSTLSSNDINCPFCDEQGFDGPGLKWHLLHHCDAFKNTEEI